MICPICKSSFEIYNYFLTVSCQTVYFCKEECQSEAKKILIYNRSSRSKRIRNLIREMLKQPERKEEEIKPTKKEEAKQEPPERKFKSFGYRLFMERIVEGLSINELAKKIDVVPSLIEIYEKGSAIPTDFILKKIAKALNCKESKLMPKKK
jgi:ribosome-binding protein aMBF1 (putative translation factor)